MTSGVCVLCGQIPKLPKEFARLHLAARPTSILTHLYNAMPGKVHGPALAALANVSSATLSVHISRIRSELRYYDLPWVLARVHPASYVLLRSSAHDKDNLAEREETSHSG